MNLRAGGFNHRDPRIGWVPTPVFAVVGQVARNDGPEATRTRAASRRSNPVLTSCAPGEANRRARLRFRAGATLASLCRIAT